MKDIIYNRKKTVKEKIEIHTEKCVGVINVNILAMRLRFFQRYYKL